MTGLRIEIDVEKLVHESWKKMPLRRRMILFLMTGGRARREIEAIAVRKMKGLAS